VDGDVRESGGGGHYVSGEEVKEVKEVKDVEEVKE
jgi:hypothetical protein